MIHPSNGACFAPCSSEYALFGCADGPGNWSFAPRFQLTGDWRENSFSELNKR